MVIPRALYNVIYGSSLIPTAVEILRNIHTTLAIARFVAVWVSGVKRLYLLFVGGLGMLLCSGLYLDDIEKSLRYC